MTKNFYMFTNGKIKRKDNTLRVISDEKGSRDLQYEVLEDIYLFGETEMNTNLLNFISRRGIMIHIFNHYGFYSGSFVPRERQVSGFLLVDQVNHYSDAEKRLILAKKFVEAAACNIYRNLRYYDEREREVEEVMKEIQSLTKQIPNADSIASLMGIEGNIRKKYYSVWEKIIKADVEFEKRVKQPPDNIVNTLISFINSLVYTTALSEIYKTQLNPTVSYLHEPGTKRFSLSLDLAEIFKPLIAERMIFSMLNKRQITESDFERESNFLYLKEGGKRKILEEYEKRLARTIRHKDLGREVSYRYLFRLECYKLIKHLIGEKEYEGFKIWW
ncbi:MAG: type I-B CRISPR-associated endonuclease Cas1b [Peptostreptococcaceae bacterium]|nr:type I-B CRISPR-associated endonuclease Cas1b [Peptostreptococcaceae bacterium]